MKKDFIIPKSENVYLGIVPDPDGLFDLYIINQRDITLRNILITSSSLDTHVQSSTLRYFLETLDPLGAIKFECVMEDVMNLNNHIMLSYYISMEIFEKEFEFTLSLLNTLPQVQLPILNIQGWLIQ